MALLALVWATALPGCAAAPHRAYRPDAAQRGSRREAVPAPPDRGNGPRYPGSASTMVAKALAHYQRGELKTALAAVRKAREAEPFLESAHEVEARIAYDLGELEVSRSALRAAVAAHPQSAAVQNTVGKQLVRCGLEDEGIAALERACELSPRNAGYARDLASAHLARGQIGEARGVLRRAMDRNRGDTALTIALARFSESNGDWEQAAALYRLALKADPENPRWRARLAHSLYETGDYAAARSAYAEAIRNDAAALSLADHVRYGDACLRGADHREAQAAFGYVSRHSPVKSKEVEMLRAICAIRRGDTARAGDIMRTARMLWPDDADVRRLAEHASGTETVARR